MAGNGSHLRTWTDDTGRYRVEATFVAALGEDTVRLLNADGRYVRVEFHRLSVLDQQYVREQVGTIAMSW